MLELVMADDEILTLLMLEKILDWDAYGISIVGKATDGQQALEILFARRPHLLITDICMPELDGLELIERVRAEIPEMKIILLSAHGEFEYAQRAIESGVFGYLLKPLDDSKLRNLIERAVDQITKERMHASKSLKEPEGQTPQSDQSENYHVQKVKQFVKLHYHRSLTMEEICTEIGVSKNYLSNLFKKITGENIWDYVTYVRIETAKTLLRTTAKRNYEIAYEVGYENPSYFTKVFKKTTGMMPQEYRDLIHDQI
ncbi:YesN/AraC family two-component response regulator [Paenibacillus shirakamiensis]|uniref:YesN/AraC family two-component response regulator n=1 Tax=Paenibacillus shirakamiensis TaxID=1265935 RepID=A0ABS4JEM8_9BACL|nr:response regulator [Paenibacillus shirakamiensis]MBP2000163.1 YesN/AraC family two-component response regulator [Paenibacillus shirakamiensis]